MNDPKALLARFEPKEQKTLQTEPQRQVCAARFSPCGRYLCAAGFDGRVHRWAVSDEWKPLAPIAGHGGWVQALAFDAAGALHSVDTWGQLSCTPYADEAPTAKWTIADAHDGWIHAVAVSPDGSLVATCGDDRRVRVWSAADGAKRHEFAHDDHVLSLAFHPSGTALVAGDLKGVVKQWELATGTNPRAFDAGVLWKLDRLQDTGGARCLQFSRDGNQLLCAGTKPVNGGNVQGIPTVLVFDWATGERQQALDFGQSGDVYVTDLLFHPEGFVAVAISGNPGVGKLMFRRLTDEAPFFTSTKMANCHSVSLHPDGLRWAVAATNGGSNGNGRNLNAQGEYPGNWSPIHILASPAPTATQ
jgi:WD40 repeat protein